MISPPQFLNSARNYGFGLYTGVPCSYLQPLINCAIDAEGISYVGATNEGDAVAIASGAAIGGTGAVVLMQNSGLGNCVSPLTSLNAIFEIPVLLIVTLRGEPGGPADEPQHRLMGGITGALLELMEVAWEYLPSEASLLDECLMRARKHMAQRRRPYALVVKKDTFSAQALKAPRPARSDISRQWDDEPWRPELPSRSDVLRAIHAHARPSDVLVATTGYTGRELYACGDHDNQLYIVGSMGCASAVGLGLALARPDRRVIVVDGDGAALMRLGALATIGHERPRNLCHFLLDNESHESTGGQSTVSHSVDLGAVARDCGYPRVRRARGVADVAAVLDPFEPELTFVHVKTALGTAHDIPRPRVTPAEVATRLQAWLRQAPSTKPTLVELRP